LYSQPAPCQALVPDLVTMLNWPPAEWPYSALNWLVSKVNSATDSWITGCVGPLVSILLSSTPSMVNPLKRGRVPPIEPPEPRTPAVCVVVPGTKTANSLTSPPRVFTGKVFVMRPSIVVLSSEVVVLTNSEPASTSTTAETDPISSGTLASAIWFDSTVTPFRTAFLNPSFSIATV